MIELDQMPTPTRGKLIIELIEDKVTAGGLYLPDNLKSQAPQKGLVIAVGSPWHDAKRRKHVVCCQVGDIAHFKRVWNREIKINGKICIVLQDDEVVGRETNP